MALSTALQVGAAVEIRKYLSIANHYLRSASQPLDDQQGEQPLPRSVASS